MLKSSDSVRNFQRARMQDFVEFFIENSPSGRTQCKKCSCLISKDQVRIRKVDTSEWEKYKHEAIGTEGESRGYVNFLLNCISS